jgi:hypothetical protein
MNDTADIRTGLITFESGKAWFFCEDLEDHYACFIHARHSVDDRYLHVGDIISYRRIDSTTKPGKFEARQVRWVGRNVARQVSAGQTRTEGGSR